MNRKIITMTVLVIAGVYFLLFHSAPFPLSHDAMGFPPYHMIHSTFGVILLIGAGYLGWKK